MKLVILSCVALRCIQVASTKRKRRKRTTHSILGPEETADTVHPPQILFFYTSWCPHCEKVKPEFEKVKARHPNINFMDVDLEQFPDMASLYNVKSVPTFIALINGRVVDRRTGFQNASELEQMIEHVKVTAPAYRAMLGDDRKALPA